MNDFHCDKCGLCCQNLRNNPLYSDLDDGSGVCKYYDRASHLCTIYDHRPIKCNIEKAYAELGFDMPFDDYLELNYEACRKLKEAQCQFRSY